MVIMIIMYNDYNDYNDDDDDNDNDNDVWFGLVTCCRYYSDLSGSNWRLRVITLELRTLLRITSHKFSRENTQDSREITRDCGKKIILLLKKNNFAFNCLRMA